MKRELCSLFFLGSRWRAMPSLIPLKRLLKFPCFHDDYSAFPKPASLWLTRPGSHPSPVSWMWRARGLQKVMDVTCLELASRKHEVKGHTWKFSPAKDLRSILTDYTNERIKALSTTHQRQTSYLIKQHFISSSTPAVCLRSKNTKFVTTEERRANKLLKIYSSKNLFLCLRQACDHQTSGELLMNDTTAVRRTLNSTWV